MQGEKPISRCIDAFVYRVTFASLVCNVIITSHVCENVFKAECAAAGEDRGSRVVIKGDKMYYWHASIGVSGRESVPTYGSTKEESRMVDTGSWV